MFGVELLYAEVAIRRLLGGRTACAFCRRRDDLRQEVEPLLLQRDSTPGDDDTGGKPDGKGFSLLVVKGKVEDHGVRSVIVVAGEKDLLHRGEGYF